MNLSGRPQRRSASSTSSIRRSRPSPGERRPSSGLAAAAVDNPEVLILDEGRLAPGRRDRKARPPHRAGEPGRPRPLGAPNRWMPAAKRTSSSSWTAAGSGAGTPDEVFSAPEGRAFTRRSGGSVHESKLDELLFAWGRSPSGAAAPSMRAHLVSGPVGSGKSTLALLIAGLLRPTGGAVRRHGISSVQVLLQFRSTTKHPRPSPGRSCILGP